jgi:hypothetical protein
MGPPWGLPADGSWVANSSAMYPGAFADECDPYRKIA